MTLQQQDTPMTDPTTPNPQADAWRDYTSAPLSFDDGIISVNRDGSGYVAFDEMQVDWETDDESGKTHVVGKFSAGEAQEIRDHLNKYFSAAQPTPNLQTDELVERLLALHVWPQFVADHHAEVVSPRQQEGLYAVGTVAHDAAARITAGRARIEVLEGALREIADHAGPGDDEAAHWCAYRARTALTSGRGG